MRRRRKMTNWLWIGGAVVVGSLFATQIKEFISKIPVIGDLFAKVEETTK